ncbi:MAG: hypothetical protein KDE19_12185, partial [Caldilineaceae bacterium]|nr:hypothetical protein [Caldilineaceae bacterium]
MRRVIFLFLDGVGLGPADPAVNPLAATDYPTLYPTLTALLNGSPLVAETGFYTTERATLVPADANFDVAGRPQSATGQTAILTGKNAPALLGEHYGPRPDDRVRAILGQG